MLMLTDPLLMTSSRALSPAVFGFYDMRSSPTIRPADGGIPSLFTPETGLSETL
jgi:hypothetical protein